MPATPAAAHHLDASAPRGGVGRFFALAYALTWAPLLPASLASLGVLSGDPADYLAAAPLAVFAPTIAAVIAARREGGKPAVRALLRGLRAWRVRPLWYVVALAGPALLFVAARGVYGLVPGAQDGPWLYLPERPEQYAALLLIPIGEEIGWRGFALPRLIARSGAARATAIVGLLWGVWHVPMFLAVGQPLRWVVIGIVFVAVGNVFFTWFYRRSGASLLLAVLLHVGLHINNPTRADPGDALPLTIVTVAYAVLAAALVLLDRRAFTGSEPSLGATGRDGA